MRRRASWPASGSVGSEGVSGGTDIRAAHNDVPGEGRFCCVSHHSSRCNQCSAGGLT